jgi:polysaccharide biosynthesis/export protein
MNLHPPKRAPELGLVLTMLLMIVSVGFLPEKAEAQPRGPKLFQKLESSPKNSATPKALPSGPATLADDPYAIGPEDVLKIDVWHEPEVSSVVAVRPDGKISLPLVGDLTASGLTPSQLQASLTQKLQAFISNPTVAVTVQEVKSRKFNVLGEVQHPGSYALGQPVRVLDAIGMAGGFRDFAKVSKIYILRPTSGGGSSNLPFNYKQVVKGIHADQNIELEPGDTIVVP